MTEISRSYGIVIRMYEARADGARRFPAAHDPHLSRLTLCLLSLPRPRGDAPGRVKPRLASRGIGNCDAYSERHYK